MPRARVQNRSRVRLLSRNQTLLDDNYPVVIEALKALRAESLIIKSRLDRARRRVTLRFAIPPDGNEGVQAKMNDRTLGSDPVPLYRTAFAASSGTNHSSDTSAATS